jgi:hypothetical protein
MPLGTEIKVVASYLFPSIGNHVPFSWELVKDLLGKPVSMRLRAAGGDLSVVSICSGND